MPTVVSDLTLPIASSAVITTKVTMPSITTTNPLVTNGNVMQLPHKDQQSKEKEIVKINRDVLIKESTDEPYIIKYRQKYYDIKRFLKNHPGGINTLRGLNNADMTTRFLHAPPHSDAAMYLLKEYEIKPTSTQLLNNTKRRHRLQQTVDGNEQEQQVFADFSENGIELLSDPMQEDKNNNQLDESLEVSVMICMFESVICLNCVNKKFFYTYRQSGEKSRPPKYLPS